ncbi:MAG TPA: amidohydrolase family protein [Bryobacteraceae bacterium]|nr:amidohydrolase family protein [Bryobacteraceae bacterium]
MKRRALLAGAFALPSASGQVVDPIPIIDSHIHLFDPSRPQGVPWPSKDNAVLYKPALPGRYRSIATPLGVKGAIVIECSPWPDDNEWVLSLAATDRIVVGTVGHLQPGAPAFREQLERLRQNPLFRGIRCGNLWGADIGRELSNADAIADLKRLAEADLELDLANPTPKLIADTVRLTDALPELRVIVDHLPRMDPPSDPRIRMEVDANLRRLGERRRVYAKLSGVLRRVDGRVPLDLAFYKPALDRLWDLFGEDRLVYGSDWPNSDQWGSYADSLRIVREFLNSKSRAAAEKVLWRNSVAAYRWTKRDAQQPA